VLAVGIVGVVEVVVSILRVGWWHLAVSTGMTVYSRMGMGGFVRNVASTCRMRGDS